MNPIADRVVVFVGHGPVSLEEIELDDGRNLRQFLRRVSEGTKLRLPNEIRVGQRLLIK